MARFKKYLKEKKTKISGGTGRDGVSWTNDMRYCGIPHSDGSPGEVFETVECNDHQFRPMRISNMKLVDGKFIKIDGNGVETEYESVPVEEV